MSHIEAGQRYRLPSGNTVEVVFPGDADEWLCEYIEVNPLREFGDGLRFSNETMLSERFLKEMGVLV